MPAEDFVFDGRRGKVVGQERAPFVFDAVDHPAGGSAGAEGADRSAERRPEVETVRTGPVAFEDAFEGMAAGQAAWVADPWEPGDPGGRQVQAGVVVHRLLRHRAVPGEDQVEDAAI